MNSLRLLLFLLLLAPLVSPGIAERLLWSYTPRQWFRDIWGEASISPDGKTLAFIRENEVWTVPSSGGLPNQLTRDGASKLGLTWQDAGHLVFNSFDGRDYRCWRLSLRAELEEIFVGSEPILSPVWSHDGRKIAAAVGPIESARIAIMDKDGTNRKLVSPDGVTAWSPAWSSDDGMLAFVGFTWKRGYYVPRATSLWMVKADGSAPRELTREIRIPGRPGRAFPKIGFTSGAEEIVVAGARGDSDVDLWAVDVKTGSLRRLTDFEGDEISPSVSRDGALAFIAQRYMTSVVAGPIEGDRFMTAAPSMSSLPYWSPDGKRLSVMTGVWRQSDWTETWDLATLEIDVAKERFGPVEPAVVGDHEDFGLVWSPDGRWYAFHSHRGGTDDIYVRRVEGGPEIRVSRGGEEIGAPAWSPDGRKLLFDGYLPDQVQTEGLWIVDFDPERGVAVGSPRVLDLGDFHGEATHPVWSPDGTRIAFVGRDKDGFAVFVTTVEGGTPRRLTSFHSYDLYTGLDWRRGEIAFSAWHDGTYDVFTVSSEGGTPRRITTSEIHESHPRFSPDGGHIAFTAWRHERMYWVMPYWGKIAPTTK